MEAVTMATDTDFLVFSLSKYVFISMISVYHLEKSW